MDRAEAEAIYDSGREACVEFILDLANRFAQHEDRLKRLEEQARQDSRTSSRPPSMDPPKSRAQRRAEARAKARELMRREREQRQAGGQPVTGVPVVSCGLRIRSTRSSITIRSGAVIADADSMIGSVGRAAGSVATRSPSYRRSA